MYNPDDTLSSTMKESIENAMREVTRGFFNFQPLDAFQVDSYNHMVLETIPEILRRNPITFEPTG